MIENRRLYLNEEETKMIQDGKCVNREIRGDRVGQVYKLKIIPKKKSELNPRPFVGRPMSDKDWEVIDE